MDSRDRIATFLIPFPSRNFLRDWDLACAFLRQTVAGLLGSDDPRLGVVIVGHDSPMNRVPKDSRVQFLECDFSPPDAKVAKWPAVIIGDKMAKLQNGWKHAQKNLPSRFVMSVDPDDFVSRKLVGFLSSAEAPGYRISSGWIWSTGNQWMIEASDQFDELCGSSVVFRSDVADLEFDPYKITHAVPEHVQEIAGRTKFTMLVNELHALSADGLARHGLEMKSIPFRAAVYRIGNANSFMQRRAVFHSLRFFLGRLRRTRLLNESLRQEFGINANSGDSARTVPIGGARRSGEVSSTDGVTGTVGAGEKVATFIIPLVARIDEEQWRDRCARLRQTLSSLLNSTNPDFEIVVAGHDKPDNLPYDKRVHFVPVDFERPPRDADIIRRRRDMLWKIRAAWDYARRNWSTRYVMRVDADDMLSNKLVQWLAENGELPGYRLVHGWITKDSWRRWLKKEDAFYLCCGSSVIVDARYTDFEIEMTPEQLGAEGIAPDESGNLAPAQKRTLLVSNKHGKCLLNFDRHGLKMGDIPFRAAVYRLGSAHSLSQDQHNISSLKMFVSSVMRSRPITASVNREFALGS